MNKKNKFIQFGLETLGFKSKEDLIENLFIKSIYDTYERVDKRIGIENDIRDRFIYDLHHKSFLTKDLVNKNILFINWERWVFKNEEDLGRTDLSFALSGIEFVIECKRLKNASSKYISEGLNRFVNKEYSENESYAGMMGFVIECDINNIRSSLMKKCQQECHYFESDFVCSKENTSDISFVTSHTRKDMNEINIYHLFFEFTIN